MNKGFSLIEIMVSVALFMVVMTISLGALLTMTNSNKNAQESRSVMDNINFALENMIREIRLGSTYHCGFMDPPATSLDCAVTPGSALTFRDKSGTTVSYSLEDEVIKKRVDTGTREALTASDVKITGLQFYVSGAEAQPGCSVSGTCRQPQVLVIVNGEKQDKKILIKFSVQSTATQRFVKSGI